MKTLLIVRHGQTASNAAGIIQGSIDTPLSPFGLQQAEALRQALAPTRIDLILSSPLQRAYRTAEVINQSQHAPLHTDERLRERSWGVYEGGPREAWQSALAASQQAFEQFCPPGGETLQSVLDRAASLIASLHTLPADTVLLSAHNNINKCLILLLQAQNLSAWEALHQANCCINTFHFDTNQRLHSVSLNVVEHLHGLGDINQTESPISI